MRLKKHREDVKYLKKPMTYKSTLVCGIIANRYLNLIRAFEYHLNHKTCMLGPTFTQSEKRALKDAGLDE